MKSLICVLMVNLLDKSALENASSLNVSGRAQYSERFRLLCHGVSHKEPIVISCATAERQFNGTSEDESSLILSTEME